jgi:hypothetical protein
MNQSASLFQLIHSLTRSEKRYFTVVAATHRDSSAYLKLFKAIDSQEAYDEKALKQQFSGEPFIKYYAVLKVQLYHFLLKNTAQLSRRTFGRFSVEGINDRCVDPE